MLNYLQYYEGYKNFGKRLITILLIRNNDNKKKEKNNVSDSMNILTGLHI